ncbi:MAG: arginine--tRNA ligase [Deltaproteobacteria bacterium]|nr:arginine--tRNA ligase [Deltaproteobacteria bacterium]MBW2395602.1 arginine--tRNA ligase [Deltaproteobacteria bacterium]
MRERLAEQIQLALGRLLVAAGDEGAVPPVAVDSPRQKEHGDFACNSAMVLAKRLKRPPREIATALIEELGDADGLVVRAEVAGPGFVNFWLAGERWQAKLGDLLRAGDRFGKSDAGKNVPVQVEFVSANPTGPLSIGHGRQAILGDCIARLLDNAGYQVTREYYFNNGGRQMRVLGNSVRARYLERLGRAAPPDPEALANEEAAWSDEIGGLPVVFPRDGYQGDYIGEIAQRLIDSDGEALVDEPGEGRFREAAETSLFAEIRGTLESIGIHFDVFYNENSLYDDGKIEETLGVLRETGRVYEEEGAVWFRYSDLGLDRDRVLVKSSGEPTYLLPDIAYHRVKFDRGFATVIDVQGADHKDQGPFVCAAIQALGHDADRIEFVFHEFVTLSRGGKTVKQSTRKATFVTIDELLADVGQDVFRLFMVQRRPESHLDFDVELAEEEDWTKNPAYYLQYAHARTHGIERQAQARGIPMPGADDVEPARLALPEEIDLIKKLGEFPEVALRAAETRAPHHVAYYLREVAGLWSPYVQDKNRHAILSDDAGLTAARLGLTLGVRIVLARGLELLGMSAPERM